MNRIALELGFIKIYWYSIFIFLGMLTACLIIYRESKRKNINIDFLINLIFNTIIFGIIGARLYYVLFNFEYYLANPVEILEIWNGGLAIHGGILTGLITILIYCNKEKIPPLKILDIIVVGVIIGQSIGRWGNFFNSEAYGAITTLENLQSQHIPKFIVDGMYIMGEYRQPTFLYESIGCFIGFIILLLIRKNKKIVKGTITASYLIIYGIIRFFIESMRSDSLMLGALKIAQIISLVFIIMGMIIIIINTIKRKNLKS